MKLDDKILAGKKYIFFKIVRLYTNIECFLCGREIVRGSAALLAEGNFMCVGCTNLQLEDNPYRQSIR